MDSNNKSYVDLEFYQNVIPQLVGEKTTGFDSAGPHERRTIGDLIITVEDSGNGSFSPVSYKQWQPGSDFRTFSYFPLMQASSTHPPKSEFKISIPYDAFGGTSDEHLRNAEGTLDLISAIGGTSVPGKPVSLPFKTLFIRSGSSASNIYYSKLDEHEQKFNIFSQKLFESNETLEELSESNAIILNIDNELKKYFKKHPEKLYDLSPRKFEELIASIFKDLGFDVELTQATRDGGRDIIASIRTAVKSLLTFIECKKYAVNNKVGVGIIRKVAGVHYIRKPSKSIIVTTSYFTKNAIEEAELIKDDLDLRDFNGIKEWLKKY